MSIIKKISLLLLGLILLSMSSSVVYIYIQSNKTIISQKNNEILAFNKSESEIITLALEKETAQVFTLSGQKDFIRFLDSGYTSGSSSPSREEIVEILKFYAGRFTGTTHVFLGDRNGNIVADSNGDVPAANMGNEPFVKSALSGVPGVSTLTKENSSIIFTAPVFDKSEVIGFVANEVKANIFKNLLDGVKLENNSLGNSYIYLLDLDGTIIYHPESSKVGTKTGVSKMNELAKDASQGKAVQPDIMEYTEGDRIQIAAYSVIPKINWILVATIDREEVTQPAKQLASSLMIGAAIIALIAMGIGYLTASRMVRPIKRLSEIIDRTARFELVKITNYEDIRKRKDETGVIGRAIQNMRVELRSMAKKMLEACESSDSNARTIDNLMEELKLLTDETLSTTQELSAGMQEAAATTQEVNASTQVIGIAVGEIAQKAEFGVQSALEISRRAEELKESAAIAGENAANIYNDVRVDLMAAIEQSRAVTQIEGMAQVILQITSQTNLLALNAAIEAARAGEYGKGFAVVADEIRKLAEQSSKAADSIKNTVSVVKKSVENLSESSGKILNFMDTDILVDYEKLIKTGEQYSADAGYFKAAMAEFSGTSNQLRESIEAITRAVNEISITVNEAAKGSGDIASGAVSIAEQISNVSDCSRNNLDSMQKLEELIRRFTLDDR